MNGSVWRKKRKRRGKKYTFLKGVISGRIVSGAKEFQLFGKLSIFKMDESLFLAVFTKPDYLFNRIYRRTFEPVRKTKLTRNNIYYLKLCN